ncbi:hypothetical protein Cyagr_0129 [Cyanobium gracile PCC 6307]|uniref:DUF732 domain-containing protein n=1 Tax=Cyanobium gracile (strain ATCC 27147 / PCC 6307) TaxID=292564 RepID=K9P1Y5_CYAGP|nr:hypothetical protein Cyagr_0129 [Cyanobium gracile PCC 6307]
MRIQSYRKAAVLFFATALTLGARPIFAESPALKEVMRNGKQLANELCIEFRILNASGISVHSESEVSKLAKRRGISVEDARLITTYANGLTCSEVF